MTKLTTVLLVSCCLKVQIKPC